MRSGLHTNILVISDLHLGEDLRPGGAGMSYLRHLVKLERELEAFLAHHTRERLGGRPWTLVVNGDMVDFMSIMLYPDEKDTAAAPATAASPDARSMLVDEQAEERLYGLGYGERQSQKKLESVIVRHQGVFGKLAEFLAAGNELVIVVGNHDFEFQYSSVQRTLTEWLCGLAIGAGAPDEERQAFQARIQFCPWFYYRENLVYIEHGHQYDEYCSFDYLLHPVHEQRDRRGGKKSRIALSLAHAGMRYFASQIPDYDPHTAETWGFLDYVTWAWAQGLKGAIRLSYAYGMMVWRVVELWYALIDRKTDSERRAVHQERLKALSAHWHLAEEKVMALDGLKKEPVGKRIFKLLAALFIDRVLLGALALAIAAIFLRSLHGWWKAVGPVGTLVVFGLVNELLNRMRLESPAARLRVVPQSIQRLVRAPFIVFGHSHAPERVQLDGGVTYFNTGTWASEDERQAFTHLLVSPGDEGQPKAELRQWRNGASLVYDGA